MKEVQYERKGPVIKGLSDGKTTQYPSINAAKRASRKIQKDTDGALGLGTVRVIK